MYLNPGKIKFIVSSSANSVSGNMLSFMNTHIKYQINIQKPV